MRYARLQKPTPYDVLVIASMIEREASVSAAARRGRDLQPPVERHAAWIDATLRPAQKIPPTRVIRQSVSENPTRTTRGSTRRPLPRRRSASRGSRRDGGGATGEGGLPLFVRNADCRSHFFTASESESYAG